MTQEEILISENNLLKTQISSSENALSSSEKIIAAYKYLDKKNSEFIAHLQEQDAIKQTKVEKFHADSIESEKRYEDVCKLFLPIVADMIDSDGKIIINFVDGYTILVGNPKDDSGQSDYDVHIQSGILLYPIKNDKILIEPEELGFRDEDIKLGINTNIYPDYLEYPLSELLIISDIGEVIEKYLKHKNQKVPVTSRDDTIEGFV